MESNYTAPNAELKDDMIARGRVIHIFFAALSGFLVIPFSIVLFLIAFDGDSSMFNFGRSLLGSAICAVVAGTSVSPFRTLAWYWAIPFGIVVSVVFVIATSLILGFIRSTT